MHNVDHFSVILTSKNLKFSPAALYLNLMKSPIFLFSSLLCPLPFSEDKVETVNCAKSCMKFDGFSELDNKRVLVRGCGTEDANACNKNFTYFGAVGVECVCNSPTCNSANFVSASNTWTFQIVMFSVTLLLTYLTTRMT